MKSVKTLEALPSFLRREKPTLSPVETMLKLLTDSFLEDPFRRDDFDDRLRANLHWAFEDGLIGQSALDACIDQAETRTNVPFYVARRQEKLDVWNARRQAALTVEREPRDIKMQLDPVFFQAMLEGRKGIEGRAYDPSSDKNYPDIRAGDRVWYRLSARRPEFATQLGAMGLRPDLVMMRPIVDEHFSPTVFGMYEEVGNLGTDFQPMLPGIHAILARGAVYYDFPGYPDLIRENGFIGIEHSVEGLELHLAGELTELS